MKAVYASQVTPITVALISQNVRIHPPVVRSGAVLMGIAVAAIGAGSEPFNRGECVAGKVLPERNIREAWPTRSAYAARLHLRCCRFKSIFLPARLETCGNAGAASPQPLRLHQISPKWRKSLTAASTKLPTTIRVSIAGPSLGAPSLIATCGRSVPAMYLSSGASWADQARRGGHG